MSEKKQLPKFLRDEVKPRLLEIPYAEVNEDGDLPQLPVPICQQKVKAHLDALSYILLTTPGMVENPLTEEDRRRITASEVLLYQDIHEALQPNAPQAKRQYWLDRILLAQPKRIEAVHMTGDIKDWRQALMESSQEIDAEMNEARRMEEKRWNEEIVDVESVS